ncbi:Rhizopine catabolism protein mocC [Enterobacter asburiae]|uniref:Rhizopine catabolism protein mocC n=1 Tax=Enterobacter asburiae TaxID=61645 RepID=A0A376FIV9_ENTAS|nr:Rhizopine catabolism protein mocC [Enterobacter asburiae]
MPASSWAINFRAKRACLAPSLQRHDLQLVSGWYSGRLLERSVEEEIAAVQSHLTLLRELGAKVLVFAEVSGCIHGEQQTPVHLRPRFPQERLEGVRREAHRICPLYAAAGRADCLPSPYGPR